MKYEVVVPFVVWVTTEVEAESKEDAIDIGAEEACITGFCGNGSSERLIGVYEGTIHACDVPLEENGWEITVEEVE